MISAKSGGESGDSQSGGGTKKNDYIFEMWEKGGVRHMGEMGWSGGIKKKFFSYLEGARPVRWARAN